MSFKEYGQKGVNSELELGKGGPSVKANGTVIEVYTEEGGATLAKLRSANPVDLTDVVTLGYLQSKSSPVVIGNIYYSMVDTPASSQFTSDLQEGKLAICNDENEGTSTDFVLNRIYRLDTWVSSVGDSTWTEIIPHEGMSFVMTDASVDGIDAYLADHVYVYDEDNTEWDDIGPAAEETYIEKNSTGDIDETDGASVNFAQQIAINARVTGWTVNVTSVFDTGATMELGYSGSTDAWAGTSEIDLETVGVYSGKVYDELASAQDPLATIAGSDVTTGTGNVQITIHYSKLT